MTQSEQMILSGIQEAVNAFASQAPDGLKDGEAVHREVERLFHEFDAYDTSTQEVEADERISDLVKNERRAALRDAFPKALDARLSAIQQTVDAVQERARIEPPALDANPAVSEARLSNARSDARMMLDSAGERIPDVMRQLVESNSDPAVTHLLMFTSWPALYLQSRGDNGASKRLWDLHRSELLESVLPPEQAAKARTAKALKHLKEAVQIAGHAKHFALADRGL